MSKTIKITRELVEGRRHGRYWLYNTDAGIGGYTSILMLKAYLRRTFGNVTFIHSGFENAAV